MNFQTGSLASFRAGAAIPGPLYFVIVGLALATPSPRAPSIAHRSPNIILIMADDLGYGDLGCYGNQQIRTPNLDRLASEGLRMTHFYASGAWCLPSRKGLMTGIHPYRGKLVDHETLAIRTTLAELLKSRGYRTALLGKWHLGMEEGVHPLDQGFDYFYGTSGSNDVPAPEGKKQVYETFKTAPEEAWPIPLLRNRERIEFPARQSLFTKRYTEEAVLIIRERRQKPFFIYLAHNMPHVPIFASEAFKYKSKAGLYGDVVEELDWSVGQIADALQETGKVQDTLLVFTSDNGPWSMFRDLGGSAEPLRGEKGTGWEGGTGVPAIFSWPGKIPPAVSDAFMVNIDLYATIAAIVGIDLPDKPVLDSIDMSSVFLHGKASPRRAYVFFNGVHRAERAVSYRSGRYRIHFWTNDRNRNPDTMEPEVLTEHDPPLLFDLIEDRGETRDIAGEHPDLLKRLSEEFRAALKALGPGYLVN